MDYFGSCYIGCFELSEFIQNEVELSKTITDILSFSTARIKDLSKSQKADLFDFVVDKLFTETKIPDWLAEFIEEFMFSIPYEDILDAVQEMKFDEMTRAQTSRNNRILSIMKSIKFKKLPTDSEIIDILDFGTSKMVYNLLIIIDLNSLNN